MMSPIKMIIDKKTYYVALIVTLLISGLAYYLLICFCEEMSQFDF
jgi:hypothetical protein